MGKEQDGKEKKEKKGMRKALKAVRLIWRALLFCAGVMIVIFFVRLGVNIWQWLWQ